MFKNNNNSDSGGGASCQEYFEHVSVFLLGNAGVTLCPRRAKCKSPGKVSDGLPQKGRVFNFFRRPPAAYAPQHICPSTEATTPSPTLSDHRPMVSAAMRRRPAAISPSQRICFPSRSPLPSAIAPIIRSSELPGCLCGAHGGRTGTRSAVFINLHGRPVPPTHS